MLKHEAYKPSLLCASQDINSDESSIFNAGQQLKRFCQTVFLILDSNYTGSKVCEVTHARQKYGINFK